MSRLAPQIVSVTTTATAAYGQMILGTTTTAGFTVTLPRPSVGLAPITIKKVSQDANVVTVVRSGVATIDNVTSIFLENYNQSITVVPNGTNWMIVSFVEGTAVIAVAPGAPTIDVATAGDTTATVNWTVGTTGGSPINDYQIKTYDNSGSLLFTNSLGGTGISYTKTGLTNGSTYKFKVAAVNVVGTGAQTAFSNTVVPAAALSPGGEDTFNRANENPIAVSSGGQTWILPNAGAFQVVSNKAVAVGGSGSVPLAFMETSLANATLTVDVNMDPSTLGEVDVVFRGSNNANYWRFLIYAGSCYLSKIVAGVATHVGGFPAGPNTGAFSIKVTYNASAINTFVNVGAGYVAKHSVTDAALATATKAGIASGAAAVDIVSTFDNFLVVP